MALEPHRQQHASVCQCIDSLGKTKNRAAFCPSEDRSSKDPPGATQGIGTEVLHPDGADPDWTPGL